MKGPIPRTLPQITHTLVVEQSNQCLLFTLPTKKPNVLQTTLLDLPTEPRIWNCQKMTYCLFEISVKFSPKFRDSTELSQTEMLVEDGKSKISLPLQATTPCYICQTCLFWSHVALHFHIISPIQFHNLKQFCCSFQVEGNFQEITTHPLSSL